MSIGTIARKLLGSNFNKAGQLYRSVFVDLNAVAHSISSHISQDALILDIGGGSGHLLNHLLVFRKDLSVIMLDLSPTVGNALQASLSDRVETHPQTSMAEFSLPRTQKKLIVLISDVIHHVPIESRNSFFTDLKNLIEQYENPCVIIKDVQPGHIRSYLGFLADRYISGDRNVALISKDDVSTLMRDTFGSNISMTEADLYQLDKPNFALVFNKI